METAGIEPTPCSVQARGAPRARPRERRGLSVATTVAAKRPRFRDCRGETAQCGRVESNHHSQRRRGYSALSSPVLSVRTR